MGRVVVPHEDFLTAREHFQTRKAQKAAKEHEPGVAIFNEAMRAAKAGNFSQEQALDLLQFLGHRYGISRAELDDDQKYIEVLHQWHSEHRLKDAASACDCSGACADCEVNLLIRRIKNAAVDEALNRHQSKIFIQWLRLLYDVNL